MATGLGKTVLAGHVLKRWPEEAARVGLSSRRLFLAHREELVNQSAEAFRNVMPDARVEVEMGEQRADLVRPADVLVASVQSLFQSKRLLQYARDHFGQITVDEAHHYVKASRTYDRIVKYFDKARLLGLTATPDRADELALGQTFGSVAYTYDVMEAVKDAWLVPIIQQLVLVTGYDLSRVRTKSKGGDLHEGDLDQVMRQYKVLHGVCSATVELANADNGYGTRRPTLIFASSVGHARDMADILNKRNAEDGSGSAASIDCKRTDKVTRRAIIRDFRAGRIQYLANYNVLSEGFDAPETRLVVIARPTKSRALYAQFVGRGTRPLGSIVPLLAEARGAEERAGVIRDSAKPGCLIVDVCGISGTHKLITTADILGGKYDDRVVEAAKKAIAAKPKGRGDVMSELAKAKRELDEQERLRRHQVIIDAQYTARFVDPFDLFDVPTEREPGWLKGKEITPGQRSFLQKAGIPDKQIDALSLFQASKLIDKIIQRRNEKKCTYGQAKVLARYGESADCTFEEASRKIDALAANGWRPLPK